MAITKLTMDSIREPGPNNTLMGKVNEIAATMNNGVLASGGMALASAATVNDAAVPTDTAFVFFGNEAGAAWLLTGIANPVDGKVVYLQSGGFQMTLKHNNAGSAAANRIYGRGAADTVIAANTVVALRYSVFGGNLWFVV